MQVGQYTFDANNFEYMYQKNQKKYDLDRYFSLYTSYCLKIAAAKDARIDTAAGFIKELNVYKDALANKIQGYNNKNTEETFFSSDSDLFSMSYPEPLNNEYQQSVSEFYNGLLLFRISQREVWTKAQSDSAGIFQYYKKHARSYKWKKRMNATIYYCIDKNIARQVRQGIRNKNSGSRQVHDKLCDADEVHIVKHQVFFKGNGTLADGIKWEKGCSKILEWNGKFVFLDVHDIIHPSYKSFDEARGDVIADYQSDLEYVWIEQLEKKYPVILNEGVWVSLKKKYEDE